MRVVRLAALLLAVMPFAVAAQEAQTEKDEVPQPEETASQAPVTSRVPLEEIRRYVAVYNAVRAAYVEPVEDSKLMQSAIRGLLLDLDPHSTYFDKKDAQAFDEKASGAYEGIGVELLQQKDSLKVIAPIDDTPAAKAGLRSGDLIIAIDGKPVSALQASEPLRGKQGTSVVLTLVREGADAPFDVSVIRETIRITSVRSRLLEPGYAYIRLSTFQANTGADFNKQLSQLQAQSGGQLKGMVLDLRSNPGGLLTAAVQVADDLLESGGIVSTRGRISVSDARFDATAGDLMRGAPVIVLVDAGSASASEVLAGALRDNQRARIIGSRTFGKGSVQTVLPLDNGDSVKLTTARYYTPSGKSIQATGIVPDVELLGEAESPARSSMMAGEVTLPGHLQGDDEGSALQRPGIALPGDGPIAAALAELKQPGVTPSIDAQRAARAQAAQAPAANADKDQTQPAPEVSPKASEDSSAVTPEPA